MTQSLFRTTIVDLPGTPQRQATTKKSMLDMTSAEGSAAHDRTLTEVVPEAMLWGTSSNVNRILASGPLGPKSCNVNRKLIRKTMIPGPPAETSNSGPLVRDRGARGWPVGDVW